jgi:hypothetical protein
VPYDNVQNYKPKGIHAIMRYHSNSPLFPSFLSSQLPIFPLYPLAAGDKEKEKEQQWNSEQWLLYSFFPLRKNFKKKKFFPKIY